MPLNAKQEKLLAELMNQPTVAEAAKATGYTERNVYRLLAEPACAAECRGVRQEALAHATTRLQVAAGKAVAALVELVDDSGQPGAVRASASRTLLELAYGSAEADQSERLAEIERQLAALMSGPRALLRVN